MNTWKMDLQVVYQNRMAGGRSGRLNVRMAGVIPFGTDQNFVFNLLCRWHSWAISTVDGLLIVDAHGT